MILTPGRTAQLACILEATARKPGNVHRFADFEDTTYLDYLLSATALVEPLDRARADGVGKAVLGAIEATRQIVATNTNLGMVLLFAPLAAVPADIPSRQGVQAVLEALTVEDARLAYRAIRLANPGGMGTVANEDVAHEPSMTLRDAMCLAGDRDLVARQYAHAFADVFDLVLPKLREAIAVGQPLEIAIVTCFLEALACCPDTLIERKGAPRAAIEASMLAARVLSAGPIDLESASVRDLDDWLRADGHTRNPGATADLVAAALYVALREGTIRLPRPAGPEAWYTKSGV